ncbi:hypothetical protein MMC30_004911 [Trapelia coarctata]|nr:hypothetical protein [Trapelia coarctata]
MLSSTGPSPRVADRPYHLDKDIIRDDLTREKPIWILSAYGPGKLAPLQLFGGSPREQSFEELRLRHYELAATGKQQQAIQEAQVLVSNAEQQIQTALRDLDGAIKYIVGGENQHPNRKDVCEAKGTVNPGATGPATPALGQQPAFGQPSLQSTFGQPSSLPANPFAKPSGGAFANQPVPAFGNPSSTFGQPTPLNPFAQKANPIKAQPPPANPFATAQAPPNPFAAAQTPSNPFAAAKPPANPFAAAQAPSNPFAAAQSPPSNPFAKAQSPNLPPNPFAAAQPSTGPRNPFDTAKTPVPTGFASQPSAPASGPIPASNPENTRKGANDRWTLWRGKPITYIDNEPCFKRPDGNWERVWFPEGVPTWTKAPEVPEGYWTKEAEEEYKWAMEHRSFKDGKMPEIAPKPQWTSWDF